MATRFYYEANNTPPVSPAFDGGWQSTAEAVRRKAALTKSAATETLSGSLGGAAGDNDLVCQIVSPPLDGDQTISGSWTHVLRARELAGTDNIRARRWALKVVSNDGSTVRGTLRAYGASGTVTEYGTALSGILMANLGSLTSVNALNGDRVVIETGIGSDVTGTTPQWEAVLGGNGTDHAATNGDTTGTVGWVEFSQTLAFQADTTDATVTPDAVAAVASIPTPALSAGSTTAPASVAAVAAVPTPALSAGATVQPAAVAAVASVPTPTVTTDSPNATVTPATVAVVAAAPTPARSTGWTVTPAAVAATVAAPTPGISAGSTVMPAAVAAVVAVPTPAVEAGGSATVAPARVAVVAAVPTPSLSAGWTATPVAVAVTAAVPTPALQLTALVQPAAVAALVAVPTVTLETGASDPATFGGLATSAPTAATSTSSATSASSTSAGRFA